MQTCNPNTGEIQHKYNIDNVAIDDEAGFVFNNGTIEGEGHKTGPGTEQTTAMPGYTGAGAELGDGEDSARNWRGRGIHSNDETEVGEPEDKLAELIQGQVQTTLMLADDSKNENFCLGDCGSFDGDDGGDGYSPLGIFGLGDDGLDGDDDGNSGHGDGDEHHHGRHSRKTGDQTNRQAGRLGLTSAERR
jgi:hypothetical protein